MFHFRHFFEISFLTLSFLTNLCQTEGKFLIIKKSKIFYLSFIFILLNVEEGEKGFTILGISNKIISCSINIQYFANYLGNLLLKNDL
jgi:hypothetical protein